MGGHRLKSDMFAHSHSRRVQTRDVMLFRLCGLHDVEGSWTTAGHGSMWSPSLLALICLTDSLQIEEVDPVDVDPSSGLAVPPAPYG